MARSNIVRMLAGVGTGTVAFLAAAIGLSFWTPPATPTGQAVPVPVPSDLSATVAADPIPGTEATDPPLAGTTAAVSAVDQSPAIHRADPAAPTEVPETAGTERGGDAVPASAVADALPPVVSIDASEAPPAPTPLSQLPDGATAADPIDLAPPDLDSIAIADPTSSGSVADPFEETRDGGPGTATLTGSAGLPGPEATLPALGNTADPEPIAAAPPASPTDTGFMPNQDMAAETTGSEISSGATATPENTGAETAVAVETGAAEPVDPGAADVEGSGAAPIADIFQGTEVAVPVIVTDPPSPPPRFDVARIEADGRGLVAGTTAPGDVVEVLLNGVVLTTVEADATGAFVVFISLPPASAPRVLSLLVRARRVASVETIIVGPTLALTTDVVPGSPDTDTAPEVVASGLEPPTDVPQSSPEAVGAPVAEAAPPVAGVPEDVTARSDLISQPRAVADAGAAAGEGLIAANAPVLPTAPKNDPPASPPTAMAEPVATPGLAAPVPVVAAAPPVLGTPVPGPPARLPLLRADAEGVRVLQPVLVPGTTPEALQTVALDAIAYDPAGDVQLSGRASGGGGVRLYVDNAFVIEAPVADDGTWATGLPDIGAGTYMLRVDQIDVDGDVVSRMETPFRREEPATLAAVLAEDIAAPGFQVAVRTVQPGNTLWGISRDRYGKGILYVQVFEANRDLIRDPDLIYPGQILRLPDPGGAEGDGGGATGQ